MFAGHLAAGLALKKMERCLNLGWLFFAALFPDFLIGILILLGLEQAHPENYTQKHYFTFPYSHSLVASIVWSLLFFGITYAALPRWTSKEHAQAGAAMGLVVFSHFILDWLTHIPELPIIGEDSPKIGLSLWNNLPLALTVEAVLVAIGFIFYLALIKPKTNLAKYGVGALLLFITTMTVLGMSLATMPPPVAGAAMSWIIQPILICGLSFWLDKGV